MSSEISEAPPDDLIYPHPKIWSTAEFESLIGSGFFNHQRVELVGGILLERAPMRESQACVLMLAAEALRRFFPIPEFGVREQMPMYMGEHHRPEPNIAVVRRSELRLDQSPSQALIIVEVSELCLRFDRADKASLYAMAGIEDYWILNVADRVLEVRREPRADRLGRFGFDYGSLRTYAIGESVAPLALPDRLVEVNNLFS